MGNPIDEPTQARINDMIVEVCVRFATEFSLAYTQGVIKEAKEELLGYQGIQWQLSDAPIPTEVLKTGILTKVWLM